MKDPRQVLRHSANVVEYLRFGGLETGEEPTPYAVELTAPVLSLRRYLADGGEEGVRTPVLLVPPLMLSADVWDVSPSTSAVALLHRMGLDPWVVDFGDPGKEPGGLRRDVTDHVLAVSRAIDHVHEVTGRQVHIGGYSQGGLFCYQAAALRGCAAVASIFALGSPMEPLALPTFGLPARVYGTLSDTMLKVLGQTGLPGWASANLFTWTSPRAAAKGKLQYLMALGDRDSVLPRERQRRFLSTEGWIAFPGPAISQVMETMTNERFVRGGLVFGDRTVSLAEITCPILVFTGELDDFAPPRAVRDVARATPAATVWERRIPTGHFGLGVGGRANRTTWPTLAAWAAWQDGTGPQPDDLLVVDPLDLDAPDEPEPYAAWRAAVDLATSGALAVPGLVGGAASRAVSAATNLASEAVEQVPRLLRLERVGPTTVISYARLLEEAFRRDPDGVCVLFDGRAHTHRDVKDNVDLVARQLLAVGVRRGEHVGVLMESGVPLMSAVAALSRLGAVAVLLRPDGDHDLEARLGRVSRLLVDDQHAQRRIGVPVHLVSRRPSTHEGVASLASVPLPTALPRWYSPDPGRGRDLAFVLLSGEGEGTRATPVTNRRWALSALGAASAASLTAKDTVFSASPLYHPSGLLLATAAPVAVGARLALARSFDPSTFWQEARTYGATVVPYTWAMLQRLLDEPVRPEEAHHPVRLFLGSGMPRPVWEQVLERFAPVQVVEMFAVARTDAILADVSGRKTGCVGRPLPGTARVELGVVDPTSGELLFDAGGRIRVPRTGETGRLLVAVDAGTPLWEAVPLRGLLRTDDAWVDTGELFRRDADGDLWPLGPVADDLVGPRGRVRPAEVAQALGALAGAGLSVCLPRDGQVVAVFAARDPQAVTTARLRSALAVLPDASRPDEAVVIGAMPLTRWSRPSLPDVVTLLEREPGRRWRRTRAGSYAAVR